MNKDNKKKNNKIEKKIKINPFLLIFIITLILEIAVFNYRFFQTMNYKPVSINKFDYGSSIEAENDGILKVYEGDSKYIELKDLNMHVKNIYLDIYDKRNLTLKENYGVVWDHQKMLIYLSITDDGNSELLDTPERFIVKGVEKTKYIPLQTTGISKTIRVNFKSSDGQTIVVNDIVANKPVPFSFNILRMVFIYCVILLAYALRKNSKLYSYEFKWNFDQKNIVLAAIVLNIILASAICFTNPRFRDIKVQYDELVQAFMDGHLYLNEEPPKELIEMENPYDKGARDKVMEETGARYKWDHAYYNGKYYVYFGVLPALVYYLPYRMINNAEFPTNAGVFFNISFYIIFSYWLIKEIVKRWFNKIPFINYMVMCQVMVSSSGIVFALRKADLYAMPITMAMALVVMGLYFWISAKKKNGDLNMLKLMIGSMCMALVSWCRPHFLIMSFLAVPLFWDEVFKEKRLFSKNSIPQTIMFALPYVIAAAAIMWYNNARFGSPFDFGANYNLTTNDMTNRGFKLGRLPLGIFAYLFQLPVVFAKFPFFTGANLSNNYVGKTITEFMCGGIFATHPIFILCLFVNRIKDELKKKKLYVTTLMLVAFIFIVVCADAEMSGILYRYYLDFSYIAALATAIVSFVFYEKYKEKFHVAYFLNMVAVLSLIFDFATIFMLYDYGHEYSYPNLYYTITSALTFWM